MPAGQGPLILIGLLLGSSWPVRANNQVRFKRSFRKVKRRCRYGFTPLPWTEKPASWKLAF